METATATTEEKNIKNRTHIEEFIKPENQKEKTEEELSPSGRYKLLIRWYATKEGSWNYSRGTVTRVSDGMEVCDIVRNYSSFHHSFVTKGETEYLITGRSYMSQTVVNLETGQDMEPQDYHYNGSGFCWAHTTLSPDGNVLIVDGCHWAAPYEFRFYDFSDPEGQGWPEISVETPNGEGTWLYSDEEKPVFNADGTITVCETAQIYTPTGQREDDITMEQLKEYGEAYDDESNFDRETDVKLTLERRGDKFVVLDTWKSEYRQKRDARNAEYEAKRKAEMKHWQETDATLAKLKELLETDPDLELKGVGWIGSSQNARDNGEKNNWFFRPTIISRHPQPEFKYDEDDDDEEKAPRKNAELKWGTVAGDIIDAEPWTYGKGHTTTTFPKTDEGLKAALDLIREHYR